MYNEASLLPDKKIAFVVNAGVKLLIRNLECIERKHALVFLSAWHSFLICPGAWERKKTEETLVTKRFLISVQDPSWYASVSLFTTCAFESSVIRWVGFYVHSHAVNSGICEYQNPVKQEHSCCLTPPTCAHLHISRTLCCRSCSTWLLMQHHRKGMKTSCHLKDRSTDPTNTPNPRMQLSTACSNPDESSYSGPQISIVVYELLKAPEWATPWSWHLEPSRFRFQYRKCYKCCQKLQVSEASSTESMHWSDNI